MTEPNTPPIPVILHHEKVEEFRSADKGASRLKALPIFSPLLDPELKNLYERGSIVTVKPAAHIFVEGEPSRGFLFVLSGTLLAYRTEKSTGQLVEAGDLGEGDTFGETSLFCDFPRPVTLTSVGITYIYTLDAAEFQKFVPTLTSDAQLRLFKNLASVFAERAHYFQTEFFHANRLLWQHTLEAAPVDTPPSTIHQPEFITLFRPPTGLNSGK